jgi:hypothetical protein
VTKRVRLTSARELKAIGDNGLHEAIVGDCAPEVSRALAAFVQAVPGQTITLDVAVGTLARLLSAQDKVRALVVEVAGLGGSALDEEALFMAMATWIIDNQIGRGFEWCPSDRPARR